MRHRLFNFAAAVSLLLFLATTALWIRSYWRLYGFTTQEGLDTWMVGEGVITWKHRSSPDADYINASGTTRGVLVLGAGAMRTPALSGEHLWTVQIPFWLPTVMTGFAAALAASRLWRARRTAWRLRHRLCLTCGYDRRATPYGERCPECGTSAPQTTTPAQGAGAGRNAG